MKRFECHFCEQTFRKALVELDENGDEIDTTDCVYVCPECYRKLVNGEFRPTGRKGGE